MPGVPIEVSEALAVMVKEVAAKAVAEAEGYKLHLSSKSSTGYFGVYKHSSRFQAQHANQRLGTFDTAVEAAVTHTMAWAAKPAMAARSSFRRSLMCIPTLMFRLRCRMPWRRW